MKNASFKSKSIIASAGTAAQIVDNGFGDVIVDGLAPFAVADFKGYSEAAPAVEVSQEITIGGAVPVVVVASTVYSIKLGDANRVDQGFAKGLTTVSVTSPAVLSGTPNADLVNAFVKKINALR